jgi:hypothetical protein
VDRNVISRTGSGVGLLGAILIVLAVLVVLIDSPMARGIALVLAVAGVGLRIEAAITASHRL